MTAVKNTVLPKATVSHVRKSADVENNVLVQEYKAGQEIGFFDMLLESVQSAYWETPDGQELLEVIRQDARELFAK